MDLDSIEGLNEIRLSVYRVAMKLMCLQKLCHMDMVSVRHITAALNTHQEVELNRQEVIQYMNRMFHSVSQEVPGHVTTEAKEETCSLMFRLIDRSKSGFISSASLQTSLIALSAESLLLKYTALVQVAEDSSGSVSRSGLRSLLQDLSQVPAAVQEDGVFSDVEAAVRSCFHGVLTATASKEHVLSWLKSEPQLLQWLPTMYRLSVGQNVRHAVRCHTCKTRPITGLRYRCMKCVNIHLCQNCFLTERQSRKHTTQHPVLEFCTQPTWKESLTMFMHSARNARWQQRYTQREADRRPVLVRVEHSALPPSDTPTRLAASAVSPEAASPSSEREISQTTSVLTPSCSFASKALQVDTDTETQQLKASDLLTEVRNLQRDKWLMERQLQAWRVTVQSEQGILEDRCSVMEVTVKTLREHNLCLQRTLTQALDKMEAQKPDNDPPPNVYTENKEDLRDLENTEDIENSDNTGRNMTPTSDRESNTEEDDTWLTTDDEWSKQELRPPSPSVHQDTSWSHVVQCDEEEGKPAGGWFYDHQIKEHGGAVEIGQKKDDTFVSEEDFSPEQLLQETVERLKTAMKADRWKERQICERKSLELLQAADRIGDSIHRLVDAVKTNTY